MRTGTLANKLSLPHHGCTDTLWLQTFDSSTVGFFFCYSHLLITYGVLGCSVEHFVMLCKMFLMNKSNTSHTHTPLEILYMCDSKNAAAVASSKHTCFVIINSRWAPSRFLLAQSGKWVVQLLLSRGSDFPFRFLDHWTNIPVTFCR